MTLQATTQNNKSTLLRRTLQANAIFSGISGVALLAGVQPLTSLLGLNYPFILVVVAVICLLYAGSIFLNTRQEAVDPAFAWFTIIGDTTWVLASLVILFAGLPLTIGGWWAVAIVAEIVAVFAILQYFGLRRVQQ